MRSFLTALLMVFSSLATGAEMIRYTDPDVGNRVGVGIGYIGVTGVALYVEANRSNFGQTVIGFGSEGTYAVTADYAFGYRNVFQSTPSFTPYWGVGAVFLNDQDNYWRRHSSEDSNPSSYFGARMPFGLNLEFPRTPLLLAVELVPTLLLTPSAYSYVQGGLSARVLF